MLEARLDNMVFRLGFAPTRRAARQLVTHRHIELNGVLTNIPSAILHPGDVVSVKEKSNDMQVIGDSFRGAGRKYPWLEVNSSQMSGKLVQYPSREDIPENINEQLIVELYSK